VIAIALQVYRVVVTTGVIGDTFLIAAGLLMQYWIAVQASTAVARPQVPMPVAVKTPMLDKKSAGQTATTR
jgi:hypothetical protein